MNDNFIDVTYCSSMVTKEQRNEYTYAWTKRNPDQRREINRNYYASLRKAAFEAYGSKCACCEESELKFLALDHVNNDGSEHRKLNKISSTQDFLRWLKNNNYPDIVQVLCHNCNFGKHLNGGICPHDS